jgi:arylsulfatase A-like enzyme
MSARAIHVRFATAISVIAVGVLPLKYASDSRLKGLRPRNAIIITLDTTRADVLAAYGGVNVETPALDRLAREGIVFDQATTTVPLTLPAHTSLLTGLLPQHHGVRDNTDPALDRKYETLAEALHSTGVRTAGFISSAVLGSRRGLAQGFDKYSEGQTVSPRLRRPANLVVDEAIQWIDAQRGVPFFAWLHLYDAHAPYTRPEPYRTMYEDVPYLGAIAFMDAQIRRLLTELEQQHLLDRTLIVVASDHGESLGDHGEDGHGMLLYQSTMRVPLIVRMPGITPKRVTEPVRLVDVMPTVLDAFGVAASARDGVSLLPAMTGSAADLDLEVYSESLYPRRFGWSEIRALRSGRFKFVAGPLPELYDLDTDPGEQRNIYAERRSLASAMSARLAAFVRSDVPVRSSRNPDSESGERLAALGYVNPGGSTLDNYLSGPAPDPKECIGVYNTIARMQSAGDNPALNGGDFVFARRGFATTSFDPPPWCVSRPLVSALLAGQAAAASPARPRARTLREASR